MSPQHTPQRRKAPRLDELELHLSESELLEHYRTAPLPKAMDWLPPRPEMPFAKLFDFEFELDLSCCAGGSTKMRRQAAMDDKSSSNRTIDTDSISSHTELSGSGTSLRSADADPVHVLIPAHHRFDGESDRGYALSHVLYNTDDSDNMILSPLAPSPNDCGCASDHYFFAKDDEESSRILANVSNREAFAAKLFWHIFQFLFSKLLLDNLKPSRSSTAPRPNQHQHQHQHQQDLSADSAAPM